MTTHDNDHTMDRIPIGRPMAPSPSSEPNGTLSYTSNNISNSTNNSVQVDPTVQSLVNDFFCSQFELKGETIDLNSTSSTTGTTTTMSNTTSLPNHNNNSDNNTMPSTSEHRKVAATLRSLGEAYINMYQNNINDMVHTLDIQKSNASLTYSSVSNELFIEGIKWSHIVTYFVFSTEFAYYASHKGCASVNDVAQWQSQFISQRLLSWIKDNGGWEGIVNFAQQKMPGTAASSDADSKLAAANNVDLKNILCGAAGAVGIFTLGLFLSKSS